MKNKRGLSTLQIFAFIFLALFVVIFLGIGLYSFSLVNGALDQDFIVATSTGETLSEINDKSFGQINDAFAANADLIGIGILFGMLIGMFMTAFLLEPEYPKVALVLDFFLLIFCFILAVQVSQSFGVFMNSVPFNSIYTDDIAKSSTFILSLPWLVVAAWGIFIFINYSGIKKQSGQNVAGVEGFG